MKTLETPRLLLRALTIDDAAALNRVNSHPEVMRYIGETEKNIEMTRRYLQQGPLADYEKFGYGRYACIDKANDRLIGFCGLKYLPSLDETDVGYRFLPEYWGKGLATETSKVVMKHAADTMHLTRIIGLALPQNTGSINVLRKLRMTYERNLEFMGDECVLYAWEAKP